MTNKEITKKLIVGGVSVAIAGGIGILCFQIGYDNGFADGWKILPIGTEKILISVWNKVLDDKRSNCENDPDCVMIDNKPAIIFENTGSIKENFVKIMGSYVDKYNISVQKKNE